MASKPSKTCLPPVTVTYSFLNCLFTGNEVRGQENTQTCALKLLLLVADTLHINITCCFYMGKDNYADIIRAKEKRKKKRSLAWGKEGCVGTS